MKRVIIGVLICLFLFNCTKKESPKENIPYIISQNNKERILNKEKIPPPPPIPGWVFYGTNSFIIDNDSKIYYSQREEIGHICGNWETSDTIPLFIDLQPKDLIEIPDNCIANFIKANYKSNFKNITFICSKTDTLQSESFFVLEKALKSQEKYGDYYNIRRTSQEEDTVLKYKKNNESYYSDKIKWDKNRITFPFIKPKLNH
ncbi:hypothetical protein AR687_04055 [Flavobacteriaceae bacterium CRH]|nr:hypothetical protein AR687_04055 [Flavobacteriaceae bacterium CRH]